MYINYLENRWKKELAKEKAAVRKEMEKQLKAEKRKVREEMKASITKQKQSAAAAKLQKKLVVAQVEVTRLTELLKKAGIGKAIKQPTRPTMHSTDMAVVIFLELRSQS